LSRVPEFERETGWLFFTSKCAFSRKITHTVWNLVNKKKKKLLGMQPQVLRMEAWTSLHGPKGMDLGAPYHEIYLRFEP
jgi:hypothetical protein